MSKSNVIDMTARRKKQMGHTPATTPSPQQDVADLVDLKTERTNHEARERRRRQRFLLSEFFGAAVVVPGKGLEVVSLTNINEEGMAFDTHRARGRFRVGESLVVRVYLSQESYLPLSITIKHVTPADADGIFRHGCEFSEAETQGDLIRAFFQFVKAASQSLHRDKGDLVRTR